MAETKLLTISWKQNSPYGGYVQNDIVDVYFDNVSNQYKVYKNDVLTTSGNQIPLAFSYNNQLFTYYKEEVLNQVLICVGTGRLKYYRTAAFPYLTYELLANHPTCSIGDVCDLRFTDLPTITNASSETANDGSISVNAASVNYSSLPIQYSLNTDFVYGSGQTSGTFSNLPKGAYTIYARTSNNCRATIIANVSVSYTYGPLYRITYTSAIGDAHITEILEKGYTGSVTEVEAGTEPTVYRLRGESERDKFVPIIAGEIETTFISQSEFAYLELFTNDPEQFRLQHKINGSAVWLGKVLTNQYQENYISPPYNTSIIATDGLPKLNEILFLDDFGNQLVGKISQIKLIAFILRKLGLNLSIRSACNIYASSMAKTASDDPLAQAYVDVSRYYLLKETPSCAEVLKWILEPYNAHIIQWDNNWNIIRVEERIGNWDYRQYNSSGVYQSNSSYTSLVDLKNSTASNRMIWANRNQQMSIMPGFGAIRLLYDLGNRGNFYENGDFSLTNKINYDLPIGDQSIDVVPNLTGFEIFNPTSNPIYVGYEQIESNNIALSITNTGPNSDNYLKTDVIQLAMGNIDKLKINLRFKLQKFESGTNNLYEFYYIRVRLVIRYGDTYLQENGQWSNAYNEIVIYVESNQNNQWVDWEIITTAPIDPITGLPSIDYVSGKQFDIRIYLPNANDAEYDAGATTSVNYEALKDKLTTKLLEGSRTSFYDISGTYTQTGIAGNCIFYYDLEFDNASATNAPHIIRPDDWNASTNPKVWILKQFTKYDAEKNTSIIIDYIKINVLSAGKPYPDFATIEQSMENKNLESIEKQIVHGSITNTGQTIITYGISTGFFINIFDNSGVSVPDYAWNSKVDYTANSASLAYNGYLRNSSGTGYDKWERTALGESKTLEEIYMDVYSSQYNQPWKMLNGDFYSNDTFFSPLNCLRETMDDDRIYFPVALTINFYSNTYNAEFLELLDSTVNLAVGFSNGFSIGYNA